MRESVQTVIQTQRYVTLRCGTLHYVVYSKSIKLSPNLTSGSFPTEFQACNLNPTCSKPAEVLESLHTVIQQNPMRKSMFSS